MWSGQPDVWLQEHLIDLLLHLLTESLSCNYQVYLKSLNFTSIFNFHTKQLIWQFLEFRQVLEISWLHHNIIIFAQYNSIEWIHTILLTRCYILQLIWQLHQPLSITFYSPQLFLESFLENWFVGQLTNPCLVSLLTQ